MREIPLTQGSVALVDDDDYEDTKYFSWHLSSQGYAVATLHYRKVLLLHRFILAAPTGIQVDHINLNRLDCRRVNIRLCGFVQNAGNRLKRSTASHSFFKGVWMTRNRQRWVAQGSQNGNAVHLGTFDTEREAALAYNSWATSHFGEFARINQI